MRKENISKLYKDLAEIIDYEIDQDEEAVCEKHIKNVKMASDIIISAVILLGIAAIFCIYAEIPWGFYGYFAFAIISLILFKRYQKNSGALLSCIGGALFYLGNFEAAKKVLDLIRKYYDTPEGNAYKVSLYAMIAAYEKDKEEVAYCIKELETLMTQANSPYMTTSYNIISKYPLIMDAEEKGDYTKATELLQIDEKASELVKVNINYRLYKVAKVAGLEEEAAKHRAYVLEKGGDTFYKKELENVG